MSTQLSLPQDNTIKKTIIFVPIEQLEISYLNPRITRSDEYINQLAERISRNGFEITRALWAYQNKTGYKVFAGGTRLKAAKQANLSEVPIVLHEGLTKEDIVKLADEDNENDKYHTKISPIDIWAHYAYLRNVEGWTQEKIAKAKGVSQVMVDYCLELHTMPDKIKDFVTQGSLQESHLTEIMKLSVDLHLSPWLTSRQAWLELASKVGKRKLTTQKTKDEVTKFKGIISLASSLYDKLSEDWQRDFIYLLAENEARSKASIQMAYNQIIDQQLVEAQRQITTNTLNNKTSTYLDK